MLARKQRAGLVKQLERAPGHRQDEVPGQVTRLMLFIRHREPHARSTIGKRGRLEVPEFGFKVLLTFR